MATAVTVCTAAWLALVAGAWKTRTLATDTQERHDLRIRLARRAAENAALEALATLYRRIGALGRPVTSPSVDPTDFMETIRAYLGSVRAAEKLQRTYHRLIRSCTLLPMTLALLIVEFPLVFVRAAELWGPRTDRVSITIYGLAGLTLMITAIVGGLILGLEQRLPRQLQAYGAATETPDEAT